ncbi:MAG: hypothetical protein ACOY71_05160 [Gemmatimonadota bacterium]
MRSLVLAVSCGRPVRVLGRALRPGEGRRLVIPLHGRTPEEVLAALVAAGVRVTQSAVMPRPASSIPLPAFLP